MSIWQKQSVRQVEASKVCMVNDTVFDREQIAVEVEGKTYYGCCPMCKDRLNQMLQSVKQLILSVVRRLIRHPQLSAQMNQARFITLKRKKTFTNIWVINPIMRKSLQFYDCWLLCNFITNQLNVRIAHAILLCKCWPFGQARFCCINNISARSLILASSASFNRWLVFGLRPSPITIVLCSPRGAR